MRFVIDNNQLSYIRKTTELTRADKRRITLVLPPLIWAEATLFGRDNLRSLLDYSIRFGKDVSEVLAEANEATDEQLMELDPLVPRGSDLHRRSLVDFANARHGVSSVRTRSRRATAVI